MSYIYVRHRVENYFSWRKVFDQALDMRKENGEKSFQVFRNVNDPNDVTVMCKWENVYLARAFMESAELLMKMQEAGVISEPEIQFIIEV